MYAPEHFVERRLEILHAAIRGIGFSTLTSHDKDGLQASHIPTLLDASAGEFGVLEGHFARANPHWRSLAGGGSGGQFLLSRSSRGSLSNLSCPVVGSGSGSGFMALQRSISGNSIHIEDQVSAHVNKKKLGADSDPVPTFQKKILIRNLQGTVFLNSPHKSFTDFDFLKKI